MLVNRKQRIVATFGAAARNYDASAAPQRFAAGVVADLVTLRRPAHDARILELGCGTGILTRQIRARWPGTTLIASDLSAEMLASLAADPHLAATFMAIDGEAPPFDGPWFDLVISNLVFQWFDDQASALQRLFALLRPGGSLIFSTMGARSFAGWRAAHAALGLEPGVPTYPTLAAMRAMLAPFADSFVFDEDVILEQWGAHALLAHFKAIGATIPVPGRLPLSPGDLRRVIARFDADGGRDAYHIHFARITRP